MKNGLEIRNIKAATLWGYNAGVRLKYDYTDAVICDSLFLDYMLSIGLKVWKEKSTRDIIGLDFDFGTRSYEEEMRHVRKMEDGELKEQLIERVEANKDKYVKMSKQQLREDYYINGVDVTWPLKGKKTETIHYRMLYRTPSKAKVGSVVFCSERLWAKARDWLTMGLADRLPEHGAKIVELSAYAPLTTSTIVGQFHLPVEDILILKDQDSVCRTMAKIVRAVPTEDGKKMMCVVDDEETDVVNAMWDGMALIDTETCPDYCNGMALLRHHFFKACAFKTKIRRFFRDWYGEDYNDDIEIVDMFGIPHRVGDIKMITTDNAIKWKKFADLMGDDPFSYWKEKVNANGSMFGIVKTDHPSKLDDVQQMSYQMINTLPCDTGDIFELADTSVRYVERLKNNEEEFIRFLRREANITNHYNLMADMYEWNHEFGSSTWYRQEKRKIINTYVTKLKTGKITINADNLTLCGNPYALLMYAVGGNWQNDPSLNKEDGAIQCYTTRFADGEYLCGIRSPHNSPNNIAYMHNRRSSIMERYFDFSPNIIAVNGIETDIQSRMNGCDYDSDFLFVTNNPVMVRSAELAISDYPTIVNIIKESGITYDNTLADYAKMDNKFAASQLSIGESSNVAQLAMSYYWTTPNKEYYDIFVILSVVAQIAIDSIKKLYEIDPIDEIRRIRGLDCMKAYEGKDFPEFMRYTRPIETTKNGNFLPYENVRAQKNKIASRINPDIHCPMNTLVAALATVPRMKRIVTIPTENFFIKEGGDGNRRQISKIRKLADDCSYKIYLVSHADMDMETKTVKIEEVFDEILEKIGKIKISNKKTLNRLIETSIMNDRYSKKSLMVLKLLYRMNPQFFLENFTRGSDDTH